MKEISLTQGFVALVDNADFKFINTFKWNVLMKKGRAVYAIRTIQTPKGRRGLYMHRFLLPGAVKVDHRDGNGLNNQRHNLREATKKQNSQAFRRKALGTTSRFRGVCWNRSVEKWQSVINIDGVNTYLGIFKKEADAARAYDTAARKHYGEFASPNFV